MVDSEKPSNPTEGEAAVAEGGQEAKNQPSIPDFPLNLDTEDDTPPEVRKRIKALKNIQLEVTQIESQFFKEMHDLEVKYAPMFTKHFEKRRDIISGTYVPTAEECDFSVASDVEGINETLSKLKLENKQNGNNEEEAKNGIPEFWLTIFRNVETLSDLVHDQDAPILKHLTDIKVEMTTNPLPMGFRLMFHFSENEYFTNQVLTKAYEMKCEVDPKDPFSFEGPEIVKCTGCKIDWKEGKNVTVRVVQKRQKHKQSGSVRTVSKVENVPSFFDFFNPPETVDESELDEETQIRLTTDFEIGQYIRERIVPRAVLYFTGEALEDDLDEEEDDDDDSDDDEETEEDGEEEEEGDNEDDLPPSSDKVE